MRFSDWLQIEGRRELAQQFKGKLHGVPQEPSHHPEGDALAHTRLVRKAIPRAIQELKSLQQTHPQLSHVLSDLDFDIDQEEMEILKISAWLHDIGKATTTTIGGVPYQKATEPGKIQSIGHQNPDHYMPQIEDLEDVAPPETIELFKKHEPLIRFIVDHHMDFVAEKFSRGMADEFFHDGKVINDPRIKLLLITMWSDKMGRKPEEMVLKGVAKNVGKLAKSAEFAQQRQTRRDNQPKPFEGGPDTFRAMLQSRGLDPASIEKAVQNKFGTQHESFKAFMEVLEEPTSIQADIPVSKNVHLLMHHLRAAGPAPLRTLDQFGRPNTQEVALYIVGGAVRDYLNHKFRKDYDERQYKPEDIDLTTNLSEEEILERLRTPKAKKDGIRVHEKESVDTFGVVFVHVYDENGGEDFEIAPFRKDIGSADGRRPEATERGTIRDDAERRDLTMNNLYYDVEKGAILDFNPGGQGIKDIQNGVARPVGDPYERFNEDKLRVLRLIRFFSRFNDGDITQFLDGDTRGAIEKYKNLQSHGITGERIKDEFLKSIKQSINTSSFLNNLVGLDLMETVFPGLSVDIQGIERLGNTKNPRVVLAWLLRGNNNVPQALNKLKYPNETGHAVGFLLQLLEEFRGNPEDVPNISHLVKSRDKFAKSKYTPAEMQQDVAEFSRVVGVDLNQDRAQHFANYPAPNIAVDDEFKTRHNVFDGDPKEIGPKIGAALDKERIDHYRQSFQDYLAKKRSLSQSSLDGGST